MAVKNYISLDLAKKLYSLGINNSEYIYTIAKDWNDPFQGQVGIYPKNNLFSPSQYAYGFYPAFTFSEIWNKLPWEIINNEIHYELILLKTNKNKTIVGYRNEKLGRLKNLRPIRDSDVNAIAKLLIKLTKNNIY